LFPLTPREEQILDNDRAGDWTQTLTGRKFWPLEPKAGDFHLADIAQGLSNECRFGGQIDFYSVAQHCLLVHHFVDLDTQDPETMDGLGRYDGLRWALLHDAAEAYMKDIPRPHKKWWGAYTAAETHVMEMIGKRFGVPSYPGDHWPMPEIVKRADDDALRTEAGLLYTPERLKLWDHLPGRDRVKDVPAWWFTKGGSADGEFRLTPERARKMYLEKFREVFEMGPQEF